MLLEKLFGLKEHNTSLRRELVAGFTNFMTISYIIFVQPSFLSQAGMDHGAVMVATCVSSALATFLMAFPTNDQTHPCLLYTSSEPTRPY